MRFLLRLVAPLAIVSTTLFAAGCAAPTAGDEADGTVGSDLTSANEKTAFDFFVGKGLSELQAAAIVGNLQQESNVSPTSVQPGGPGRGIALWSTGARWNVTRNDNVAWYAAKEAKSVHSLDLQLAFIWYELESFSHYGLSSLRAATTLGEATYAFQKDFEACGACNESHRIAYARAVLTAYGGQ